MHEVTTIHWKEMKTGTITGEKGIWLENLEPKMSSNNTKTEALNFYITKTKYPTSAVT